MAIVFFWERGGDRKEERREREREIVKERESER